MTATESKCRKNRFQEEQKHKTGKAWVDERGVIKIQRADAAAGSAEVWEPRDLVTDLTCVDLGETLSVCRNPKDALSQLAPYCERTGAELTFSMPNAFYADRIADQFFLNTIPSAKRAMTMSAIQQMLDACHYQIVQIRRVRGEKKKFETLEEQLPAIAEQVDYFSDLPVDRNDIQMYQVRCRYGESKLQAKRPFLSVIIRTMGKRQQELKEVLLCLNAQTFMDYEVLIMIHHGTPERNEAVQKILEYVPMPQREKYRVIPVESGTRATPLNQAIDEASGRYFAVLDDDDLILANWVEAFAEGVQKEPGKVIHTYAVTQDWARHRKDLRSESEKDNFYCQPFDWSTQYQTNRCPFMSMAFPLDLVRRLKYRFDESLETGEDWKFIMQVATVADVCDIPQCTAIYRKWVNAESSTTLYSRKQWRAKEKQIRKEFGSLLRITKAYDFSPETEDTEGKGINLPEEEQKPEPEIRFGSQIHYADIFTYRGEDVHIQFQEPFTAKRAGRVRIDPFAFGGFLLKSISVYFYYPGGKVDKYEGKQIKTNGLRRKDVVYFFFSDPQLYIDLPEGKAPEAVELICTRSNEISLRRGLYLLPLAYLSLVGQTFSYFYQRVVSKFRRDA